MHLNDSILLGLGSLNLLQKHRAKPLQLLVVQNHRKLTHRITGTLAQTQSLSTRQLGVDCVHESFLVDEVRLAKDDKSKSFENFCADIKTLFFNLSATSLDTADQIGI